MPKSSMIKTPAKKNYYIFLFLWKLHSLL